MSERVTAAQYFLMHLLGTPASRLLQIPPPASASEWRGGWLLVRVSARGVGLGVVYATRFSIAVDRPPPDPPFASRPAGHLPGASLRSAGEEREPRSAIGPGSSFSVRVLTWCQSRARAWRLLGIPPPASVSAWRGEWLLVRASARGVGWEVHPRQDRLGFVPSRRGWR